MKIIVDEIMKAYSINNRTYKTDEEYIIIPEV